MSKPLEDKNISVPDSVLRDLLTPSEVRMLKNRWQIIQLLQLGKTIRGIAEEVGVGTDTVVRVARMMEQHDFANKFKKDLNKQNLPWVFGKKV